MSEHNWLTLPQVSCGESPRTEAYSGEHGSDWFIGRDRAMVSLGPLGKRHCTYRCAFCYVQGSFPRYPAASIETVLHFLKDNAAHFSIIYVSGDTDSFARPGADRGIALLSRLLELDKDVLFTTRAVFTDSERRRMEGLAAQYSGRQRLLIGCVSVSQLHHPNLEPTPIPSVEARIDQLSWLKASGIVSVLTIRPLIPMIPASEYVEIAEGASHAANVIIGGNWYVDDDGVIARETTKALNGIRMPEPDQFGPLYFSTRPEPAWFTYRHPQAESALLDFSQRTGVPFFMGSEAAVASIRQQMGRLIDLAV